MATKVTAALRVQMHPWAECQDEDCPWQQGESRATRASAKRHAAHSGHRVLVVAEDRTLYEREGGG